MGMEVLPMTWIHIVSFLVSPLTAAVRGIVSALDDDGRIDEGEALEIATDALTAGGLSDEVAGLLGAGIVRLLVDVGVWHDQEKRLGARLPARMLHLVHLGGAAKVRP